MSNSNDGYVPFSQVVSGHPERVSYQAPTPTMRPAPPEAYRELPEHIQPPPRPQPTAAAPAAAAAAQGQPSPADEDDDTVVFSKPYVAFGEAVTRIKLRRPVGKDIKRHRNPFKLTVGNDGTVEHIDVDYERVSAYIVACASPPLTLKTTDEMEYEDLERCAGVLVRFFLKLA